MLENVLLKFTFSIFGHISSSFIIMSLFISLSILKFNSFNEFKFPNEFPFSDSNINLSDLRDERPSNFTRLTLYKKTIKSKYHKKYLIKNG